MLTGPASENTKGSEEITLLPRPDLTQRTTPSVIRYSDPSSSKCCQRNDRVFAFVIINKIVSNEKWALPTATPIPPLDTVCLFAGFERNLAELFHTLAQFKSSFAGTGAGRLVFMSILT